MKGATPIVMTALVLSAAGLSSGCRLFAVPWLMWGEEPMRDVPAEYPYLAGKRFCVIVWTDSFTQMEFPHVQLEMTSFITDAIEKNVARTVPTPPRTVLEMQRNDRGWDRTPPVELGKSLRADRAILVDVTQYSMREPESTHLYRGRIAANIRVYDTGYPDAEPVLKTTVETVYPPDSHGEWGSDEAAVRRAAMSAFADDVSGLFYDRRIKVR